MTPHPQRCEYIFCCPTKDCEIQEIKVLVYPDLIEDFGFCCPFCREHMIRFRPLEGKQEQG